MRKSNAVQVTLLAAFALSSMVADPPKSIKPATAPATGIALTLETGPDFGRIVKADESSASIPVGVDPRPIPAKVADAVIRPRGVTIVFADPAGKLLSDWAVRTDGYSFEDRPNVAVRGGLKGGLARTHRELVALELPVPAGSAWLMLYGAAAGQPTAFEAWFVAPLGLGKIPPPVPPALTSGFAGGSPPVRVFLRRIAPAKSRSSASAAPVQLADQEPCIGGTLGKPERLSGKGKTSESFDIVITGDGFNDAEQGLLRDRSTVLANGLLGLNGRKGVAPFNVPKLREHINVHFVPATSPDSGVSNCPFRGVRKCTYFGIEGFWDHGTYPGFVGTKTPLRLINAWRQVSAAENELELRIVLYNCPIYGGRGVRSQAIAYVSNLFDAESDAAFINLAAHESGHAVAGLADEYQSCDTWDPAVPKPSFPNVVSSDNLTYSNVTWYGLADTKTELDKNGKFRAIHQWDEKPIPCDQEMAVPKEWESLLGLFWGAMWNEPGLPAPSCPDHCNAYGDPRGRNFFRPMARCKMRYTDADFCNVCRDELRKRIESAVKPP